MKFHEVTPTNGDSLMTVYQHIDNGGHKLTYDKYGNLHIENGHHGYSYTTLMLSSVDLDGLIAFFTECKARAEREEIARQLKGE